MQGGGDLSSAHYIKQQAPLTNNNNLRATERDPRTNPLNSSLDQNIITDGFGDSTNNTQQRPYLKSFNYPTVPLS